MAKIPNWSRNQEMEGDDIDSQIHYYWEHDQTDDFVLIASETANEAGLDTDIYQDVVYTEFHVSGVDKRGEFEVKVEKDGRRQPADADSFNRTKAVHELRKKTVKWLREHPHTGVDDIETMEGNEDYGFV